jgi:glycosyltransferase involved in cell wall biosynthesis
VSAGPRRIALNMLHVVPGETGGIEIYAEQLARELVRARPEVEWLAFVPREYGHAIDGLRVVRTQVSGRSRVRRVLGEQVLLPGLVRRYDVDLLHSVASSAPLHSRAVQVVTLHDVNYLLAPEGHSALMAAGQRVVVPIAARAADRVIAVSEFSRQTVIGQLGLAPEIVDAVPNGGGVPPGPALPEAELRARLELGDAPIVLSLSAHRPHKNLDRLVTAFARLRHEPAPLLVLPGYRTPFRDALAQHARELGVADRVRLLDWVEEEELEGLYAAARVFAFPSLAEGFGMPVLEAMARGVPVACARSSSLPEVAGDAALLFDPYDIDAIAATIDTLLGDDERAAALAEAGRAQAARFSWERAARGTLATYDRAWASCRGSASRAGPTRP